MLSVRCSRPSCRQMMTLSLKLLKKLCAYLAQNEDSQYSMTELVYCLQEMSTTDDTYSETHLKRRLLHKYGDSITITERSEKGNVVKNGFTITVHDQYLTVRLLVTLHVVDS